MADPYTSHSSGKLKLKGVKDSKVSKKKHKSSFSSKVKPPSEDSPDAEAHKDNSVILKKLEDEDAQITRESHRKMGVVDGQVLNPGEGAPGSGLPDPSAYGNEDGEVSGKREEVEEEKEALKTAAERRRDEQRRRRLEERLKREGVKTHKERVQELNRYLSGLSEHHDMPKIGPG